ncbi:hypothetical protein Presley_15 [Acinetobacter phage Presley]|uniref:Uncharacterized protein n=1 Tax=Acinetobacter phage Presley TaxID=1406780 RepID=U5PZL9_9CAUD|nr:hypothetical protein Presley_15 [Acinetobacter phage Presley]AGY48082.1 hypothetical protein Presley_15 [Acinetobacter phage Presley]
MIHIYVRTLFGYEHKRSVPIDREAFQAIMDRHATRSIKVLGIRYYHLTKQYDINALRKIKGMCTLLGKNLPNATYFLIFHSFIDEVTNPTFDHVQQEEWFKELTQIHKVRDDEPI